VLVDLPADLDRLAIGVARVQRRDIGFGKLRLLGEFGLEPVDDRLPVRSNIQSASPSVHISWTERSLLPRAQRLHPRRATIARC
jgi:hypothetical protein